MAADTPRQLDGLGWLAHTLYAVVGGSLVFGFAWALGPALRSQVDAPCRPFAPDVRSVAAPDATLKRLDGTEFKLSSLRGKLVVTNFWATYCEPCITEWPQLDRLAERLKDREDVVVLAISIDDEMPKIPPFLQRMALTNTHVIVAWDSTAELNKSFGSTKIPDTFFVDEQGTIVHAYENVRRWGEPGGLRCVESMIGR